MSKTTTRSETLGLAFVLGLLMVGQACAPNPSCEDVGRCAADQGQREDGDSDGGPSESNSTPADSATSEDTTAPLRDASRSDETRDSGPTSVSDSPNERRDGADSETDAGPGVACPELSAPQNGAVTVGNRTPNGMATYECKLGYVRSGLRERTCRMDGTWSGSAPQCAPYDCGPAPDLVNGTVSFAATTYGAIAIYECSDNVVLTNNNRKSYERRCTERGWADTTPACVTPDCGGLTSPENGVVTTTTTQAGGIATYDCAKGYILRGLSRNRECRKNDSGIWSWTNQAPVCERPRSCGAPESAGAGFNCGQDHKQDCCETIHIPSGTYYRDNNDHTPVKISEFYLDKYEITVGRFLAFHTARLGTGDNAPAAGEGAYPQVAGSGWNSSWNDQLAPDSSALDTLLKCDASFGTWSQHADHPINCITWYEAFAFCAWDGGRLPTDLEWNYVAAGGEAQRQYPWGIEQPTVERAIHACLFNGSGACTGITNIGPVGSALAGGSRWGHLDMAGNLSEWLLDWNVETYSSNCTSNCAQVLQATSPNRVRRGGDYSTLAADLITSRHDSDPPDTRRATVGARCARNPSP